MIAVSYHRRRTDGSRRRSFSLGRRAFELVVFVAVFWWLLSMWVDVGGMQ